MFYRVDNAQSEAEGSETVSHLFHLYEIMMAIVMATKISKVSQMPRISKLCYYF